MISFIFLFPLSLYFMSSVRLDLNGVYGLAGKSCVCFSYAAGCGVAKVKVIAVTDFFIIFFLLKCPLHSLKTWIDLKNKKINK